MADKIYTCGIDIGSRATKVIILDQNAVVTGRGFTLTGGKPSAAADKAVTEAILAARIDGDNLACIVSTGYGRKLVQGIEHAFTSVTCHAMGAHHAFPGTRNVLDIGAVRSAAIRLNEHGQVHRFRFNDRCSAGIGGFLESVADLLEIPLEEIGQLALFSKNPKPVPNVCAVIAQTEILSHISREQKPVDILRGVCESLADKLTSLLRQVWVPGGEITMTGGVVKNAGMVKALEESLKTPINIHHDAEFMGAIGAALLGLEITEGKIPKESAA